MINHSLTVSGSSIVRMYIWDKMLKDMHKVWGTLPTGGIPIIPAQEQPEVQDSNSPYIVYAYSNDVGNDLYQMETEQLSMVIHAQSVAVVNATGRLMKKYLGRWDDSAKAINRWVAEKAVEYGDWADEIKRFRMKSVRVISIGPVQPAPSEGGRVDCTVTIEIKYVEVGGWGESFGSNN